MSTDCTPTDDSEIDTRTETGDSETASGTTSGTDTTSGTAEGTYGPDDGILVLDGLTKRFGGLTAVDDLSFAVEKSEILGFIGPNGAGKSTLADAVAGHLPYEGRVTYRGRKVVESRPSDLVAQGLIHCTETRDLFGHMSVADNLDLGAYRHRDAAGDRREFVYELFPTLAERTDQEARTMSGGEQQMLAIARALMSDPDLLLLDEPTLGLAPVVLEDISDGIERIREEGVTVVLCEQNVTFAMEHADRVYLLENGRIEREGRPETLRGDEYIREAYLGG
jgi:branched-chain amino acid transport system ATP-binding protein